MSTSGGRKQAPSNKKIVFFSDIMVHAHVREILYCPALSAFSIYTKFRCKFVKYCSYFYNFTCPNISILDYLMCIFNKEIQNTCTCICSGAYLYLTIYLKLLNLCRLFIKLIGLMPKYEVEIP